MIHKHYDNILFVVSELRILRYNSEYGKVTEKNNHIPMYGSIYKIILYYFVTFLR